MVSAGAGEEAGSGGVVIASSIYVLRRPARSRPE
jgi:hypothetical protein